MKPKANKPTTSGPRFKCARAVCLAQPGCYENDHEMHCSYPRMQCHWLRQSCVSPEVTGSLTLSPQHPLQR